MSAAVKTLPAVTLLDLLTFLADYPGPIVDNFIAPLLADDGLDVRGVDALIARAERRRFVSSSGVWGGRFRLCLTENGAAELDRLKHAEMTKTARGLANDTLADILAEMGVA